MHCHKLRSFALYLWVWVRGISLVNTAILSIDAFVMNCKCQRPDCQIYEQNEILMEGNKRNR